MNEYSYSDPEDYPPQPSAADGGTFADRAGLTVGPDDFADGAAKPPKAPFDLRRVLLLGAGVLLLLTLLFGVLSISGSRANRAERYESPDQDLSPPIEQAPAPNAEAPRLQLPPTTQAPETPVTDTIQKIAAGVVRISTSGSGEGGSGTGFVINADGYILTNAHVVAPGDQYTVYFQDGRMAPAELVAANADLDAALLRVAENTGAIAQTLGNSVGVQIGQKVFALGFPLGTDLGSEMTVTDGIVSSIRYRGEWLQISAAVNPGNSGGPLIRAENGEIIGLITAKVKDADNIGFARPIDACKDFIRQYTSI